MFSKLLPLKIRDGEFVILFQAPTTRAVRLGHWVVLLRNGGQWEYFDSTGEDFARAKKKAFALSLRKTGSVLAQTFPVQPENTVSCGHYCLYFIANRLLNMLSDYPLFLAAIFASYPAANECAVEEFYGWLTRQLPNGNRNRPIQAASAFSRPD